MSNMKYLGQRLRSSNVTIRTHAHIHTRPSALPGLLNITIVVIKKLIIRADNFQKYFRQLVGRL